MIGPGDGAKAREVLIKKNNDGGEENFGTSHKNSLKELQTVKTTKIAEEVPYTDFDELG